MERDNLEIEAQMGVKKKLDVKEIIFIVVKWTEERLRGSHVI
jgi:hypothetical protein